METAVFAISIEDDPNFADLQTSLGEPADIAVCYTAINAQNITEGYLLQADLVLFLN
jgi:hypothetical protein